MQPGAFLYQADPTIFRDGDQYYLYGTNEPAADTGFLVYSSTDMRQWKKGKNNEGWALTKDKAYGTKGFWAPQVFTYRQQYFMAYTANEHIAIAKSNTPEGPFIQNKKQPVDNNEKQIDPFVFEDEDGKIYLYYVRLHEGNRIYVAQMEEGLSGIIPNTATECISAVQHPQSWENTTGAGWTVTEGPCVIKKGALYYLFYSANDFRNPDYAVGYATATSPAGPWTKYSGNPIISRQALGINGTGHGDVVQDNKNRWWYVLHTHHNDSTTGWRKTAIIPLNFDAAGTVSADAGGFRYLHP